MSASAAKPIVGRTVEIAYLEQCLDTALTGDRQVVFVSGEPGIGKTTIVDRFLERIKDKPNLQVGHGQCVEQYGAGEAFMPLLEIAGQLCRSPQRDQTRDLLRQYAPSWLVQLPFLIDPTELETLHRQLPGASRERMLREAAEILVAFTARQGLVLVFEDLHWSDVSTLEWLSYIAQRREHAQLLIIGTYRPTEVLATNHLLRGVVQELIARRRCEELRVTPLSEQAVSEYLTTRLGASLAASPLPDLIHRRTGGNPLFVINVVDDLLQQGVVFEDEGQWRVRGDWPSVTASVPDTLRQVIERHVERLPAAVQQLFEVASIVGVEFSAAAVAAGLQAPVEEIDQQCETLARREQFIVAQGTEEWPDGTLSERYRFRHALYHAVLYDRLTETQRVRLHRRIAERKEAAYGMRAGDIAGELAVHFERGRDLTRAAQYLGKAVENAVCRSAHQEAIEQLTTGLAVVARLPEIHRPQHELVLNLRLGVSLGAIRGYASPEVQQAYARALEISQRLEQTPQLFPALWGLWLFYEQKANSCVPRILPTAFLP